MHANCLCFRWGPGKAPREVLFTPYCVFYHHTPTKNKTPRSKPGNTTGMRRRRKHETYEVRATQRTCNSSNHEEPGGGILEHLATRSTAKQTHECTPGQSLARKQEKDGLLDAVDLGGDRRLLQVLDDVILRVFWSHDFAQGGSMKHGAWRSSCLLARRALFSRLLLQSLGSTLIQH